MKLFHSAVVVCAIALPAAVVSADPIVDGNFDAANYQIVIADGPDAGADFVNTGLDIANVGFSLTGSTFYVGLETVAPLDVNGDPTTFASHRYTAFWVELSTGSDYYFIDTATDGTAALDYADLYYSTDGINYSYVASATSAIIGAGMELTFNASDLPTLTNTFGVYGQLDGSGRWQDDQIDGIGRNVPEPATMALFAMGMGLMATPRRRRA